MICEYSHTIRKDSHTNLRGIMKKKDAVKLMEGALVGAALGAAAGLFLAPESGKELRKDLKKKSADFYKQLVPKLKKAGKMGEAEYKAAVKTALTAYGKAKKLSITEEKELMNQAHSYWAQLKKHL